MIACIIAFWLFVAACIFHVYTRTTRVCPATMPGGRYKAMAVTSFAWPALVALVAFATIVMVYDAVAVAFTRR